MLNKYVKLVAVAALAVSAGAVANAQSVTKTITLKNLPEQLAADPFTDLIYVAVPNFGAKPYDYLTVINGKTDTVIANYEIPPYAYAVAVDPLNGKVYIGGTYQNTSGVDESKVLVFCVFDKKVTQEFSISTTTGDGILGLAVNSVTGDLYVANGSDSEIDVIKTGWYQVSNRIPVPAEPFGRQSHD